MAEIRLENLHKRFADFVAVEASNLVVENGQFFVLLGPSGCGKTTTLRMIAGLEMPTSGRILLGAEEVTGLRAAKRDIAFVFQLFALYPHMNVRKNLAFPLITQGVSRGDIRHRVAEVATLLRIEHLLGRSVNQLSGGDRQRVALGRAIIRRPKAFLMDEPLGTLDTEFRALMCEELRQLHDRIEATTVYVTHDQVEAMTMADRIAVMNNGVVLQADTPYAIYRRPASKFVAGFIGSPSMNFVEAEGRFTQGCDSVSVCGTPVSVPPLGEDHDAGRVTLGVRPEHISLVDESGFRGEVFGVEYMGARQLVTVDTRAGRLKVRAPNTARVRLGEQVGLEFDADALVLFDRVSERALSSAPNVGDEHG